MRRKTATLLIGALVVVATPGCARGGDTAADLSTLPVAQQLLQQVRETGDPTLYGKAAALLDDLPDDDLGVLIARGELALAQHRFEDAWLVAGRALDIEPVSTGALAVAIDAANELGRYDEALDLTQRMVDLKPDLASLSRVSYARELRGDVDGAIQAMTQAVTAGSGTPENLAYTQVQLALLLLGAGDVDAADAVLDETGDLPAASVARARVLIAQGRLLAAAALLDGVLQQRPTAEAAILRADTLRAAGEDATDADALVRAIIDLYEANGVNTDLDTALYTAEREPGDDAVQQARRALDGRPSTFGHAVVAWALHRAGDDVEAWREVQDALALGSRDPQLRFHAAVIAHAVGEDDAAAEHLRVVLDGNVAFSPIAPPLVQALAEDLGLS